MLKEVVPQPKSRPSSPAVMLSPNARNDVTVIFGGCWITTLNEQAFVRWRASVAVHVTVVDPTGNVEPLGGAHATATGGAPPFAIAVPYDTVMGCPVGDVIGPGA